MPLSIATVSTHFATRFVDSGFYNFLHELLVADDLKPSSSMQNSISTSPATFVGLMEAQQATLELTDHDLCAALGFEREIVLTMIKAGNMRMPLTKIPALAAALELDAAELLKVALRETSPELLQVIEETYNPLQLTSTEVNLVKHLRKLCGDTPTSPLVFGGKGVVALVAV